MTFASIASQHASSSSTGSRPPAPKRTIRLPGERNREVFRLRAVEGLSLTDTGKQLGISPERVRQVLNLYFGVRGTPPAAKARRKG